MLIPLVAALPLLAATWPIRDVDVYWHVAIGDDIRRGLPLPGLGDRWAWFDPEEPWTTSQWLSESVMSWLVDVGGWTGLVLAHFALVALLLVVVARTTTTATRPWAGVIAFTAIAFQVAIAAQPRPLLVSWIGTALVGVLAAGTLRHGRLPAWWVYPLITLWANLHGQWVIAPAAIGLAAGLHWLTHREKWRSAWRPVLAVGALLAAGCLNPLGWASLTLPLTFAGATDHLLEWQLTTPWSWDFLDLAAVLLVLLWRRLGREPLTQSEVIYTAVWLAFAMTAVRNTTTASLLLLPLAFPTASGDSKKPHSNEETQRGIVADGSRRSLLVVAPLVVTVAASGIALTRIDALGEATPMAIAGALHDEGTAKVRVLNDYNTAGVLIAFGPPGIEVGIDGRAERYGKNYISRYLDVLAMRGKAWESFLSEMQPDAAVLEADAPIRHVLESDLGWNLIMTEGDYVLLEPAT